MDQSVLIKALRKLDGLLESPNRVVLLGGAAMMLAYGSKRATQDADGVFPSKGRSDLRARIRSVAGAMGLSEDWLNDAARGYLDLLPRDFEKRLCPIDLGLKHLKLFALGRPEMILLKIVALRERDEEDLEWLAIGKEDVAIIAGHLGRLARIRKDLALKVKLYLEEGGWKIR